MIRFLNRLWNSPTFTSWGNQGAQAIRLVILLPLIFRQFDEVQVASWLLFSSLTFFSSIIIDQVLLVFSRMISLGWGGASDLSPIRAGESVRGGGDPNWNIIERLYTQLSSFGYLLGFCGALLSLGLGYFALEGLLRDYPEKEEVWLAFALILFGQFIIHSFSRYAVALRGLNKVALCNRWQALFSLLSSVAGAVALLLDASIVGLAIVVQCFTVINVIRLRLLLFYVVESRFRKFATWGCYKDISGWLWPPFWRGLIQVLASRAGMRVAIIVLSRNADPAVLAGILLAVRLLDTVETMANAPFRSHVPRFGRLIAAGSLSHLRESVKTALRRNQWTLGVGILLVGFGTQFGLDFINVEINFMNRSDFFLFAFAFYLVSTIRQSLMISIIGNNVVAVPSLVVATLVSTVASFILIPIYPENGFVITALFPVILLVNMKPFIEGCRLLDCDPIKTFNTTILPSMTILAIGCFMALVRS